MTISTISAYAKISRSERQKKNNNQKHTHTNNNTENHGLVAGSRFIEAPHGGPSENMASINALGAHQENATPNVERGISARGMGSVTVKSVEGSKRKRERECVCVGRTVLLHEESSRWAPHWPESDIATCQTFFPVNTKVMTKRKTANRGKENERRDREWLDGGNSATAGIFVHRGPTRHSRPLPLTRVVGTDRHKHAEIFHRQKKHRNQKSENKKTRKKERKQGV